MSYMVIVSSASSRHRTALAELVRAAYKLKKDKKDHSVIMEGKGTDWVAMDMGKRGFGWLFCPIIITIVFSNNGK